MIVEKSRFVSLFGAEMIENKGGQINTKHRVHEFVGKLVVILKGEFKNQKGLCQQVTETGARVLTKAKSKVVTVPIENLALDSTTISSSEGQNENWGA